MARISVNAAGDLGMVPINYVAIDVGEKLNSLDGKVLELEEEVDDQFEFDRHTENRFSQGEERIAALESANNRLEGLVMELMAFARSLQAGGVKSSVHHFDTVGPVGSPDGSTSRA